MYECTRMHCKTTEYICDKRRASHPWECGGCLGAVKLADKQFFTPPQEKNTKNQEDMVVEEREKKKTCSVDGCDRPVKGKGMCNAHYLRTLQAQKQTTKSGASRQKTPRPAPGKKNPDYATLGEQIGELVRDKQVAYGDSFGRCGDVLRVLYPNGVRPEQYTDMLATVRVIDKLFRIATQKGAFGESPWQDIAGYGILGAANKNLRK